MEEDIFFVFERARQAQAASELNPYGHFYRHSSFALSMAFLLQIFFFVSLPAEIDIFVYVRKGRDDTLCNTPSTLNVGLFLSFSFLHK